MRLKFSNHGELNIDSSRKRFAVKNTVLFSFYSLFIIVLIQLLFRKILVGYAKESWQISEWLINYQGGFVRRGLLGEGIFLLHKYFEVDPYLLIVSLCLFAYAAVITIFVRIFTKNGYPLLVLPFVFFLGGPVINNFWIRKDVFLILIVILLLYFSRERSVLRLLLVNSLFIVAVLTHEAIGFFGFPALFVILNSNNITCSGPKHSKIGTTLATFIQLSPSILAFSLCLYCKGSFQISTAIWNSWSAIAFPLQNDQYNRIPGAIRALSASLEEGLSVSATVLTNFNDCIYAPLAWIAILLLIYYSIILATTKVTPDSQENTSPIGSNSKNFSTVLVFQFICVLPLFILGWDYGRWVFFWIASSFAINALVPTKSVEGMFPAGISAIAAKLNSLFDFSPGRTKPFLHFSLFLIGVPHCSWSLSFFLNSSPVILIGRFFLQLPDIRRYLYVCLLKTKMPIPSVIEHSCLLIFHKYVFKITQGPHYEKSNISIYFDCYAPSRL